jgi:hypothetical protein
MTRPLAIGASAKPASSTAVPKAAPSATRFFAARGNLNTLIPQPPSAKLLNSAHYQVKQGAVARASGNSLPTPHDRRVSGAMGSAAQALGSASVSPLGLEQTTRAPTARNTAEAFASLRAAGSSVRDEKVRNPDHMASRFIALGPRLTTLVKVPALRPLARRMAERVSAGAISGLLSSSAAT